MTPKIFPRTAADTVRLSISVTFADSVSCFAIPGPLSAARNGNGNFRYFFSVSGKILGLVDPQQKFVRRKNLKIFRDFFSKNCHVRSPRRSLPSLVISYYCVKWSADVRFHYSANKRLHRHLSRARCVKYRAKRKRTSHSSRVFKACLGVLLFAAMLEGQALNQFVFVVLVDPDVPKCDAYICMIEDLFQCHGVVRLLVHMIAERLS